MPLKFSSESESISMNYLKSKISMKYKKWHYSWIHLFYKKVSKKTNQRLKVPVPEFFSKLYQLPIASPKLIKVNKYVFVIPYAFQHKKVSKPISKSQLPFLFRILLTLWVDFKTEISRWFSNSSRISTKFYVIKFVSIKSLFTSLDQV